MVFTIQRCAFRCMCSAHLHCRAVSRPSKFRLLLPFMVIVGALMHKLKLRSSLIALWLFIFLSDCSSYTPSREYLCLLFDRAGVTWKRVFWWCAQRPKDLSGKAPRSFPRKARFPRFVSKTRPHAKQSPKLGRGTHVIISQVIAQ